MIYRTLACVVMQDADIPNYDTDIRFMWHVGMSGRYIQIDIL